MKAFARSFFFAVAAVAALGATGCQVDPAYDFTKLDTTLSFFKGAEFPVPDAQVLLKDVFPLEEYDFITCDPNGDYRLDYRLDPVHFPVVIPETQEDRIPVDIAPVRFNFDNLPDFLSGKDQSVAVDMSDLKVSLGIDSDIPAEFAVSAAIEAIRGGAVSARCPVDDLFIRYGSNRYVLLEDDGSVYPDDYRPVAGLSELFSPIPEAVQIGSFAFYANADQRALIAHDRLYNLSFEASAESPLRFSEGTRFRLSTQLDAQISLDQVGLKKAILNLGVENTMPFDLSFRLSACDASGNVLNDVQVTPDFEMIPAMANMGGSITLSTKGDLRFSSLLLELTASVPTGSPYAGTCLNRNQGLYLRGMSLYLPDGIQIRLDSPSQNH